MNAVTVQVGIDPMHAGAESGSKEMSLLVSTINQSDSAWVWKMSGLTRDGTAETNSRNLILRRERGQGQGRINFLCLSDHE